MCKQSVQLLFGTSAECRRNRAVAMPPKVGRHAIFLIDHTEDSIRGSKLPSYLQVLRHFLYHVRDLSETTATSSNIVADVLMEFWGKARIPTQDKSHIVKKILKLHNKWRDLQKNSTRRTENQISKEAAFTDTFNDLFDIAHQNALDMIKIHEDKEFLLLQRNKGRKGSMSTVDAKLAGKEARSAERLLKEAERRERASPNSIKGKFLALCHHF